MTENELDEILHARDRNVACPACADPRSDVVADLVAEVRRLRARLEAARVAWLDEDQGVLPRGSARALDDALRP